MSKAIAHKKKTSRLNRFAPFSSFLVCIAFLIALDGFNILTYNWEEYTASVGATHTIDYPVNTKTRGTVTGHITFAEIYYTVDGLSYSKDIVSNNLSVQNNKIQIRVSPKDRDMVTTRNYHIPLYVLFIIISSTFIVISIIYLLRNKEVDR